MKHLHTMKKTKQYIFSRKKTGRVYYLHKSAWRLHDFTRPTDIENPRILGLQQINNKGAAQ
jgi:hypothetical protein